MANPEHLKILNEGVDAKLSAIFALGIVTRKNIVNLLIAWFGILTVHLPPVKTG